MFGVWYFVFVVWCLVFGVRHVLLDVLLLVGCCWLLVVAVCCLLDVFFIVRCLFLVGCLFYVGCCLMFSFVVCCLLFVVLRLLC